MYTPAHFSADDPDALIARLARRSAGVLVTVDVDGTPIGTHLPILWDGLSRVAIGHIARANPQWRGGGGRGLMVLSGADAYVTPSWYPSKDEHGKAVPTWNYEAVHLSGRVEWFDEPTRLRAAVADLSALHESDRPQPWAVEDAPRAYVEAMLGAIVGMALHVDRIEAKRKLSQNKSVIDFSGVAAGLAESDSPRDREVAALMCSVRAAADAQDGN